MGTVAQSKKPKLGSHIEEEDLALLKAVSRRFPGVSEAFLVRAAIRVGLSVIVRDREKLSVPPLELLPSGETRPMAGELHHSPPADDTSLTGKNAKELAAEADRLDRSEAQTELDSPAAREAAGKPKRRAKK